ncbi:MAG: hypothetical protein JWQ81_4983 [Amycolatopsis sp.]|jgi:hypothetical protein|nr:hypothetical protein [Amycolatopsis sp.]
MVVAGLITAGLLGAPLGAQAAMSPAAASSRQPASASGGLGLRVMPRDGQAAQARGSVESDWTMLAILGGVLVVGAGAFSVYLVRRPA